MELRKLSCAFIVLLLFSCASCDEQNAVQKEFTMDQIELDLSGMQLNTDERTEVLSYKDKADLKQKLPLFIQSMFEELDLAQESDENIKDVYFDLTFSSNKVYIYNIFFMNEKNQILNDKQRTYGNGGPVPVEYGAECPEGQEQIKFCYSATCVSNTLDNYLTEQLDGSGQCVDLHLHRGAFGVNICGESYDC